ncbi:MAG: cytochrome C oxidase subunit IV family protein [Acidimicrobiales bacterium]
MSDVHTPSSETPPETGTPEADPGPVVKTSPEEGGTTHDHPSEWQYIKVALVLAAITLAEVAVYYVESLEGLLVPILIAMSVVKFGLVVLWFMHLRFDSRLFRRLFLTGIFLALFCYMIFLTSLHVWSR